MASVPHCARVPDRRGRAATRGDEAAAHAPSIPRRGFALRGSTAGGRAPPPPALHRARREGGDARAARRTSSRWASVTKLLTGLRRARRGRGGDGRPRRAGRAGRARRCGTCSRTHPGWGPDGRPPDGPPGARRIYSERRHRAGGRARGRSEAEMPFADYLPTAVLEPLGLRGLAAQLAGVGATAARSTTRSRSPASCWHRRCVAAETLAEATKVQFPGLDGVLPGWGRMEPNDWGLAFELRDAQVAALDGDAQVAADVRPFGRQRHVPLGRPRARPSPAPCWPTASSATGRRRRGRRSRDAVLADGVGQAVKIGRGVSAEKRGERLAGFVYGTIVVLSVVVAGSKGVPRTAWATSPRCVVSQRRSCSGSRTSTRTRSEAQRRRAGST